MITNPGENSNSNGLSDKEKVDLLFKNKMETASTSKDIEFFSETEANHSNMYATGILAETPPKNVSYNISISNSKDLESAMRGEHVFADDWYAQYVHTDGSIKKDDENIVMRFEKIKLDYYGNQSAAFVCLDSSGNNILKNLIPSTYASGYGVTLWYYSSGKWKIIHWLESIDTLNDIYDESFSFGGALLDTKNGIVTFYDISGNPSSIFQQVDGELYLSATKYIGETGFGEFQINDNGISDKEKLDILFKKYWNVASTTNDLEFFEENNFYHKNLFSDGLLTETPPENVNWNTTQDSEFSDISNILGNEFNIDQAWFNEKTNSTDVSSAFKVHSSNIVMRFEKIRLDYFEHNAFACFDKDRINMLKNLIPSHYGSHNGSHDVILFYKENQISLYTSLHDLRETMDISFGGALLDTNNGLVTFYDIDGHASSIFNDISNDLYLTVTKYIGNRGLDTFKHDVKIENNLDVSGRFVVGDAVDISNDIFLNKKIVTNQDFEISGNIRFKGSGTIIYEVSTNVIQLDTDQETTKVFNIQNDGTLESALVVNQTNNNSKPIAVFQDQSTNVFVIGKNSSNIKTDETIIHGTLNVSKSTELDGTLVVNGNVTMDSTLNVSNGITTDGSLNVIGDVSINENLNVGNNITIGDTMSLQNKSGNAKVRLDDDEIDLIATKVNSSGEVHATTFVGYGGDLSGVAKIDTSNNLTVNGDLRIMSGGNLIIEDLSNTTITMLQTDVKISDILHIHNEGTGPALTVNQDYTGDNDIVHFQDNSENVFIIADRGDTTIKGTLDVCGNVTLDGSITTITGNAIVGGEVAASSFNGDGSNLSGVALVDASNNIVMNNNTITAKSFHGDGSDLSGVALVDGGGNIDMSQNTITAHTFKGFGGHLSGVALVDASGNIDISNNTIATKAIQFNETIPSVENDIGTLGNVRFNASRDVLEYYGKDNVWNSLVTYKSEQPPKLRNASFSPHSQYIDISWDMFETRITDSHDGKKYPLSLHTFLDISYDFGDASSNGWETLYIGNGTYDNDGNENNPVFETFRLYGLQTTDYSNNTGYTIAFNSKPDPISTPLPSFDQFANPFDLRVYGVNQSGQVPNYVYLYGISLEPTGAPGPVEVTNTRDFQQNQFTMDLSFAPNSLNPSTTRGIDITQYDVSFHMVESKRFASADPIDHSGVYQIVWDGISGLSNTEIDLSHLYPGAKYDIMVRAQNRGLAGVDGSYGETAFTSTDFTNVGTTQYITLDDLEPVDPQGMTFTLVNSASIRCCISGNSFLSPLTIMNDNGGIDMSGISDFYVNFGKQGVDISSAGTLVTALFKKYSNSSVVSEYTTQIQYSSVKSDTSYTFLGCDLDLGDYIDKGNEYEYNKGFVYGSSIQKSFGANIDFNAYFNASINAHKCTYTNTQFSGQITTDYFYKDNYDISDHHVIHVTTPASISIVSSSVTTLCGIPSIHQLQLNAVVDISNFASYLIPHDTSNNHSFINELTTNSYSFPPNQIKTVSSPAKYSFSYSEIADVSNGTYEPNTQHNILTNVYYLDHSGSPVLRTKTYTMVLNNLGKIFKDSVTSYNGLPVHIFNSQVSSNTLNVSNVLSNNYTLMYFDGHFVGDNYSKIYNGTTINAYSDWSKTNGGYGEDGPDYAAYVGSGSYGYKWIAFDVTTLRKNNTIPLSELYLNDMHIEYSVFGVDYKAFIVQKKGNTQIFGTLGKRSMIGQTNWWSQKHTIFQNSETGNGALNNDGDVFVELVDTSVLYYILIGLPVNSTSYVRFI
jgi:hypothetical protein